MLTAALLAVALALPPAPPAWYRLYQNQAERLLDELEAHPERLDVGAPFDGLRLEILTQDRFTATQDTVNQAAQLWRAEALGIPTAAGLRVFPDVCADALSVSYWATVADMVERVGRLAAVVSLDSEDYFATCVFDSAWLTANGATVESLRDAMAPLLAVVQSLHVMTYPINPADEVHRAIVQSAGTVDVIKESWGVAENKRRDPQAWREQFFGWYDEREKIHQMRADAGFVLGMYDTWWRRSGWTIRNDPPPGEVFWTFDAFRQNQTFDETWIAETNHDTRNNPTDAYDVTRGLLSEPCGSLWCGNETGGQSIWGHCKTAGFVDADGGPGQGHTVQVVGDSTSFIWSNCNADPRLTVDSDTTVHFSFVLPPDGERLGLLGWWELFGAMIVGDVLRFSWFEGATPRYQDTQPVPRGVPLSLAVGWDAAAGEIRWALSTETEQGQPYTLAAPGLNTTQNPTWLQLGKVFDRQPETSGPNVWRYCPGCVLALGTWEVWRDEPLTCEEMSRFAPADPYPWGRE